MSDTVLTTLPKLPWWKRPWGIILILFVAIFFSFTAWMGWMVYDNVQQIKSGKKVPLSRFKGEFTGAVGLAAGATSTVGVLVPDNAPIRGDKDGKITIVQFGDYECPFSNKEFPIIRPIMENVKGVKFVYRDFPLTQIHPNAFRASMASRCAQEQDKYWAYHDQLFLSDKNFSDEALVRFATNIGLNEERFKACLTSEKYRKDVLKDVQDGIALGVQGTPTFFIDGVKIEGALPADAWLSILKYLNVKN